MTRHSNYEGNRLDINKRKKELRSYFEKEISSFYKIHNNVHKKCIRIDNTTGKLFFFLRCSSAVQ